MMWYLAAAAIVLLAGHANGAGHVVPIMCHGNAYYNVTFYTMWTNDSHGVGELPMGAMFSPVTAASHSGEYEMWRPGQLASEGVKEVAETGSNTLLCAELDLEKEKKKVHDIFKADGPSAAMEHADPVSMVFTPTHHFGSMVSMVFPSPDWFVGVYNIDLCGTDTGKWIKKRSINLYAWDAGTDDADSFIAVDDPTGPPADPISLLTPAGVSSFSGMKLPKFATLTFELAHVAGYEKKECMAYSDETYHISFQGMWTMASHPRVPVPDDAMFSPVVVASHNEDYTMWKPCGMASPGVERVAEEGPPDVLLQELEAKECLGVKDFAVHKGGNVNPTPIAINGSADFYIEVDKYHPYVSAIGMIFPSPDWFVGISSINLCDDCFWNDETIELSLQPWDAGTEDGADFNTTNDATNPHEMMSLITTDHMDGAALGAFYNRLRQHIQRMGTITIDRKRDPERDYKNLVWAWKKSFEEYKAEFEKWKEEECNAN